MVYSWDIPILVNITHQYYTMVAYALKVAAAAWKLPFNLGIPACFLGGMCMLSYKY